MFDLFKGKQYNQIDNQFFEDQLFTRREVAQAMSMKSGIYVSPDEVQKMSEPIYEVEVDAEGESTAYFYAQTFGHTLLCKVVTNEHQSSFTVKKIEW